MISAFGVDHGDEISKAERRSKGWFRRMEPRHQQQMKGMAIGGAAGGLALPMALAHTKRGLPPGAGVPAAALGALGGGLYTASAIRAGQDLKRRRQSVGKALGFKPTMPGAPKPPKPAGFASPFKPYKPISPTKTLGMLKPVQPQNQMTGARNKLSAGSQTGAFTRSFRPVGNRP